MATKPQAAPQQSHPDTQEDNTPNSGDVETGQSTGNHAAVEQLEPRANPLIEGVEGGQPRDGRGSVEGGAASGSGDVERI